MPTALMTSPIHNVFPLAYHPTVSPRLLRHPSKAILASKDPKVATSSVTTHARVDLHPPQTKQVPKDVGGGRG